MVNTNSPEPWLRGNLAGVPAVARAVLHALQLAEEDLRVWCEGLTDEELNSRPGEIAPLAFHIRHVARSADRLLTYAEGRQLSPEQLAALKSELEPRATRKDLFAELIPALERSAQRVLELGSGNLEEMRTVGSKQLPATLGGLLIHLADHTQRHVGQAITTAKIAVAQRGSSLKKGI